MRKSVSVLAVLLSLTMAVPRVSAQTVHSVAPSALEAAVQQHAAATEAERAAVLRVLSHPEVKTLAGEAGIDLRRAAGAVSTLEGQELSQLAAQARQVDEALAGGQSRVVISTTAIIIGLLVLILLIVALD